MAIDMTKLSSNGSSRGVPHMIVDDATLAALATTRSRARWASTTPSSCATRSCCAAVRAPRPARTSARPTATSSHPTRAGSSPVYGWQRRPEMLQTLQRIALHDFAPAPTTIREEVLHGLQCQPKELPPKLFYESAARICSTSSPSLRSTIRRAPNWRSCRSLLMRWSR